VFQSHLGVLQREYYILRRRRRELLECRALLLTCLGRRGCLLLRLCGMTTVSVSNKLYKGLIGHTILPSDGLDAPGCRAGTDCSLSLIRCTEARFRKPTDRNVGENHTNHIPRFCLASPQFSNVALDAEKNDCAICHRVILRTKSSNKEEAYALVEFVAKSFKLRLKSG
jgi:hypothetical protein